MSKQTVERQLIREKGLVVTDDLKTKNPIFKEALEKLEKGFYQSKIKQTLKLPENISERELALITLKKMFSFLGDNFKGKKGGYYTLQTICEELFQDVLYHINCCNVLNNNISGYALRIHRELTGKIKRSKVIASHESYSQFTFSTYDKFFYGKILLTEFINHTGLVELIDGKTTNDKRCKTLKWNESVLNFNKENTSEDRDITCLPLKIPMISKPLDWIDRFNGGYYFCSSLKDLKLRNSLVSYKNRLMPLPEDTEISPDVLEAVNFIQGTPWRINRSILEVAEKFYLEDKLNKNIDIQALQIARDCSSYEKIWFPYFMDFRGRLYCSPIYLSYQSTDMAKSLLLFAQKKQLGKDGVKWLAIHGANCFGEDKIPLKERAEWIKQNTSEILKSAENPFENNFWKEADKPLQFLAFCFEWKKMSELENPEKYKCSLPVSIDGTCNVYQHLSALMRDKESGTKVNLRALPERYDIYQIILDRLKNRFEEILESSNEKDKKEFAEFWVKILDRKLVKIIMVAVPYGLTEQGARKQIHKKILKKKQLTSGDDKKDFIVCRFLTKEIFKILSDEIPSVGVVKNWLQGCVKVFNQNKLPVQWTTPSGFKVYQGYCKRITKKSDTSWGKAGRHQLNVITEQDKINPADQTRKIFANIEHALDASHLIITALKVKRTAGIKSFASVHDSFCCLPSDMEHLYKVTRETFVEMYSRDILKDMRQQFLKQLPEGSKLPEIPNQGDLDIKEVLESEFAFS
jgi:DNA-directed RNA polymerase